MIVLKNITKEFDGVKVLNDINITFKENKITSILGGSGVGKTTLLNIIAGLTTYSGEIVNAPKKIAYAFQTPALISNLTVEENIKIACRDIEDKELNYCLKAVDILSLKDKLVKNLSVGEKQRVNFLRALLYKSNLLLIDETFSSLDIKSKLKCQELLIKYVSKGDLTVIMVTHDVGLALSFSDEIAVISKESVKVFENSEENLLKDKLFNLFKV